VSIAVLLLEGPLIHKTITMRRRGDIQLILRKKTWMKKGRLRYSIEAFVSSYGATMVDHFGAGGHGGLGVCVSWRLPSV
jgi:hypothetical protein